MYSFETTEMTEEKPSLMMKICTLQQNINNNKKGKHAIPYEDAGVVVLSGSAMKKGVEMSVLSPVMFEMSSYLLD